jgi:hypothetical protein
MYRWYAKHGGEDLVGYWASGLPLEVAATWRLVVGTDKDIRDGDCRRSGHGRRSQGQWLANRVPSEHSSPSWPGPASGRLTGGFHTAFDSGSRPSAMDPTVAVMTDTEFSASET